MTDEPLLSVRDLKLAVSGTVPVVNGVGFEVARGEIIGLVGESGSGKTMVARAIPRLLPPAIHQTGGSIRFEGRDLGAMEPRALRRIRGSRIGMVFQEPMTSLNPALTIGRQLEEGLRLHGRFAAEERRRLMTAMLARVGFKDPARALGAFPHEFSGGMRQRAMLASVMLLKPALLLADEPTTALDVLLARDVMDLMVELTRQNGTAVIMISHDLPMVARYAHRILVMRHGELVEQGPARAIIEDPQHPYTRQLVDALPQRRAARPPVTGDRPVMEVKNLTVAYPGRRGLLRRAAGRVAVKDASLAVQPGEIVALVGASGSGKTTLGRTVIGLQPKSGGTILYRGRDPFADRAAWQDYRMGCQIVFQDPYASLDPRMRVGALVGEPLRHDRALSRSERDARVREVLQQVGLGEAHLTRFPHELSGGQRQRVAIARCVVRRPAFVVADEPVSALDVTIQKQVLELFRTLQKHYGFACLFVTHDLGVVAEIADRVLVMEDGVIVESAARDRLLDHPAHPYTRRLLSAMSIMDSTGEGVGDGKTRRA
jgi:peptide/nickel transport system ATP-binding protein